MNEDEWVWNSLGVISEEASIGGGVLASKSMLRCAMHFDLILMAQVPVRRE